MTPRLTVEQEIEITALTCRGLSGPQIASGLNLDLTRVRRIAVTARKDGDVDAYRDACLWRTQMDPHRLEAAEYLSVRGVPVKVIRQRLKIQDTIVFSTEKKEHYQQRQLERARKQLELEAVA